MVSLHKINLICNHFISGIATSPAPLAKSFDSKIVAQELEELGDRLNCDITLEDVMDGEDSDEFAA